jgi:hypothetical protein
MATFRLVRRREPVPEEPVLAEPRVEEPPRYEPGFNERVDRYQESHSIMFPGGTFRVDTGGSQVEVGDTAVLHPDGMVRPSTITDTGLPVVGRFISTTDVRISPYPEMAEVPSVVTPPMGSLVEYLRRDPEQEPTVNQRLAATFGIFEADVEREIAAENARRAQFALHNMGTVSVATILDQFGIQGVEETPAPEAPKLPTKNLWQHLESEDD